jgi:hypothetical protein
MLIRRWATRLCLLLAVLPLSCAAEEAAFLPYGTRPFVFSAEAARENVLMAEELPEAPHLSARHANETYPSSEWMVVHNTPSLATDDKRDRIFDWQFLVVHGVYGASVAFDDYATARGLGQPCGFEEGNPDLGRNPTVGRIAVHGAVEFGMVVAGDAALKWFGRRQGLPHWLNGVGGSLAAAIGTRKHLRGGLAWVHTGCL